MLAVVKLRPANEPNNTVFDVVVTLEPVLTPINTLCNPVAFSLPDVSPIVIVFSICSGCPRVLIDL